MRRFLAGMALALYAVLMLLPATGGAAGKSKVYVLHVDEFQQIDAWLAGYTDRIFAAAEADPDAAAVAILIDTPGGLVVSALQMKERILSSRVRSIALVNESALSAGALIGTAAEKLYMTQGAVIGAAEPREQGTNKSADYKTLSAVVGHFTATAQARGRDPKIAQAFVDKSVKIEGQTTELLTLSAKDAVEKRYADGIVISLDDALRKAGISDYQLVDSPPSLSERAARFLTNPVVATILLAGGVIALGIEFMKPGVTIPGLVGIVSLGLFFAGNVLVGTAGWLELGLALIGVLLLVVEAFVPGFGIFGVGGIAAIVASVIMGVPSIDLAVRYLAFASVAFVVVLFGLVRSISRRGLGKSLTLTHDEKGWVPSRVDHGALIGSQGKALTVLRPAGTAQFGEVKVDVVTEGEFVSAGAVVKVLRVEGTRIVVRVASEVGPTG